MPFEKQTFYDADILSSFLVVGETFILKKLFSEIVLPMPVYSELIHDKSPVQVINNLNIMIKSGFVKLEKIEFASSTDINFKCILNGYWAEDGEPIGKGEAAVIAYAIDNDGIVASNNLSDVLYYTEKYNIPLLTSSMILSIAVCEKIISKQYAESIWSKMINAGIILPEYTFSKYFAEIFHDDYQKFYKSKIKG